MDFSLALQGQGSRPGIRDQVASDNDTLQGAPQEFQAAKPGLQRPHAGSSASNTAAANSAQHQLKGEASLQSEPFSRIRSGIRP